MRPKSGHGMTNGGHRYLAPLFPCCDWFIIVMLADRHWEVKTASPAPHHCHQFGWLEFNMQFVCAKFFLKLSRNSSCLMSRTPVSRDQNSCNCRRAGHDARRGMLPGSNTTTLEIFENWNINTCY